MRQVMSSNLVLRRPGHFFVKNQASSAHFVKHSLLYIIHECLNLVVFIVFFSPHEPPRPTNPVAVSVAPAMWGPD